MKKTKILAPALGILCLSMAASVTATVAWFSSNATVTAEGMTIEAVTATNLFIKNTSITDGVFTLPADSATMIGLGDAGKRVADITDTHGVAHKLVPVSPINNFTSYIYVADSTKVAMGGQIFSAAPEAGTFSVASRVGTNWGGLVDYVNVGAVDLYLQDEAKRDIQVTVTVTPTNSEKAALLDAVRVALQFEKYTDAYAAEPTMVTTVFNRGGRDDVKPLSDVTTVGDAQACASFGVAEVISAADGMINNQTVRCNIFFYFEGQDGAAINENSLNSAGYDLALSFTASV